MSRDGTQYSHSDVKPENIVRNHEGQLFLIDFGFSKINPDIFGQHSQGTRTYNSPTFFEDNSVLIDMVAALRTAFFEKGTFFLNESLENNRARYPDDKPLPHCIFKNLDPIEDKETIKLLSTYHLHRIRHTHDLLNNCSDGSQASLPRSMLALAAKLALLRKDPNADVSRVDTRNQFAIVALSLANISKDHPIWDLLLLEYAEYTTIHDEYLKSIKMLFECDRALVNEESMRGDLSIIHTLSMLNITSTQEKIFNSNPSVLTFKPAVEASITNEIANAPSIKR